MEAINGRQCMFVETVFCLMLKKKCCHSDCFGPCTTDQATPDQLTIPLNKGDAKM